MPLTPTASSTRTFNPSTPAGTSPADQAAGTPTPLGTFVATAYGPPWVGIQGTGVTANGTDLRPAKHVYGVAVDPSVIPLGTYLHIWPNPFDWEGTFLAFDTGGAIKGKRIDIYDWRGRTQQNKWGKKNVNVHKATSANAKLSRPPAGGGISLPSIPNPVSAVDDAASAVKAFVQFVLSPKSMGDALAKIVAWFLRLVFKAIWQYVFAPLLHWQQRATMHYYDDVLLDKGNPSSMSVIDLPGVKAFVTLSFWATGYGILWAKIGGGDSSLRTAPHKTPLGSLVRSIGNTRARRNLVAPKDVHAKTPQKPTPMQSSAVIDKVRSLAVSRPRTVRVTGAGTPTEGTPDE